MNDALSPARILSIALLIASAASAQNTWYVDVNATPPGLGTLASPYTSISFAVTAPTTLNNDVIVVAPGTYVERVRIETLRLHVRSSDGPLTTIIQAPSAGNVVHLDNLTSVLEGFTVTGHTPLGPAATAGVWLYTGTIRGCVLRDNSRGVFVLEQGAIEDSTIAGNSIGVTTNNFGTFLDVSNSIIAGNTLDFGGTNVGAISVVYSAGFANSYFGDATVLGPGVILGDPMMWDVASDELRLKPGSVCIDAGDPTSPLDPDGSRRDIGALPYDASYTPAPAVYCTAKLNSLGCLPAIGATGAASVSGSPFTLTCSNQINNKLGLMSYGYASKNVPYQGGWLCIQAPTQRSGLLHSGGNVGGDDCSGVHTLDFGARIASGLDPALVAGEMIYAQFWSRDPGVSFNTVRSAGLRFGIGL